MSLVSLRDKLDTISLSPEAKSTAKKAEVGNMINISANKCFWL
jgi:hypothetical protein